MLKENIKMLGGIMIIIGLISIVISVIIFVGPMPLAPSGFYSTQFLLDIKDNYVFPNDFYIETKSEANPQILSISEPETQIISVTWQSGLFYHKSYIYATELTETEYEQLVSQSDVIGIWKVPVPELIGGEGYFGNMADAKSSTRVDELVNSGNDGSGTIIVIIDDFPSESKFYNYFPDEWSDRVIHYPSTISIDAEHGIMTASIAADVSPNAELYLLYYMDDMMENFETVSNLKNLYPDHNIVCSNSYIFGFTEYYDSNHPLNRKILEAANNNVIVLFAAGNWAHEGEHDSRWIYDVGYDSRASYFTRNAEIGYPAVYDKVISVAGCTSDSLKILSYSSLGRGVGNHDEPDVAAPTHFTYSYSPYGASSGTSGSCPFMAGICANVLTGRTADSARMVGAIHSYSTDRGFKGFDVEFGYGVVDAVKLYDGYPNWIPSVYEAPSYYLIVSGIGLIGVGFVFRRHQTNPPIKIGGRPWRIL